MKRALLALVAVLVTACGLPPERSTITVQGLTVTVGNPGPGPLTGDPTRKGDGVALRIRGVDLTPTGDAARWCQAVNAVRWGCVLPEIPEGSALQATFTGGTGARVEKADLAGYRPGRGTLPVLRFWPPLLP
ncbi:hypothetical protein [Deinococcus soli (ex Cha et al. 2016)]|uniref:Uncharacterized protein n=1 Tax=Deinococcus soli (ex Cha et al. 2016) TaxID=1309411 RepID=A0ACC6KP69_9DEIO|nr:hypothetical protein [Deinococcus soli (ex Cha et al. 2016)]MDR6330606.1 hypothetical protein [Deinococcus soli (ex Cha et al. 2016)]MDR6754383.1 hypothetical protein [Deinococcus soli (ex Cha et al. 2016)]